MRCWSRTCPSSRARRRTRAWPPAARRKVQQFRTRVRGSRTDDACRINTRKQACEDLPPGMARGYRSTLNMVRFLLLSALLALPAAARPPLHTWTDKDGVLHIEDVPPPRRAAPPPAGAPAPARKAGCARNRGAAGAHRELVGEALRCAPGRDRSSG